MVYTVALPIETKATFHGTGHLISVTTATTTVVVTEEPDTIEEEPAFGSHIREAIKIIRDAVRKE
jgi:hypothetical protein